MLNEADANSSNWLITPPWSSLGYRVTISTSWAASVCRDVQLGEAVLMKNPVESCLIHKIIGGRALPRQQCSWGFKDHDSISQIMGELRV